MRGLAETQTANHALTFDIDHSSGAAQQRRRPHTCSDFHAKSPRSEKTEFTTWAHSSHLTLLVGFILAASDANARCADIAAI